MIRLSHSEIRLPNPEKFRQKKVILLVRNPLDIGVSRYHYKQRPGAMTDHASQTVREGVTCYNTWATYMAEGSSNCLVVKYEDLLQTPEECLRRIFDVM
ncbi:MAG: sulfotransferase domain-containing protein, partial [Cyanobacteria bacterium J06649_11]